MKIIAGADLHITPTPPKYRVDKYVETQFSKVEWIMEQCKKYDAPLLWAGDICHRPSLPFWLLNRYINLWKGQNVIGVAGQHDLKYHHKDLEATPLGTLAKSAITIIDSEKAYQEQWSSVALYGSGWDEYVPEVDKSATCQILLIHQCITEREPPPWLEDAISAEEALEEYPNFDFILSGDYHVPHVLEKDGRWVVNCGSIMRSNVDQQKHKPRVYLIDTGKKTVKPLYIPILPPEEVFNLDRLERDQERLKNSDLEAYIESMKKGKVGLTFSFPEAVKQTIKEEKPSKGVQSVMLSIMDEAAEAL